MGEEQTVTASVAERLSCVQRMTRGDGAGESDRARRAEVWVEGKRDGDGRRPTSPHVPGRRRNVGHDAMCGVVVQLYAREGSGCARVRVCCGAPHRPAGRRPTVSDTASGSFLRFSYVRRERELRTDRRSEFVIFVIM